MIAESRIGRMRRIMVRVLNNLNGKSPLQDLVNGEALFFLFLSTSEAETGTGSTGAGPPRLFLRTALFQGLIPLFAIGNLWEYNTVVVGPARQPDRSARSPLVQNELRRRAHVGLALQRLLSIATRVDRPNYCGLHSSWAAVQERGKHISVIAIISQRRK